MYYTTTSGSSRRRQNRSSPPPPTVAPQDRLSLGFFQRLMMPKHEEHFVDGMRQFVAGNEQAAARHFSQAGDLADAAFMAGVLALKREELDEAKEWLQRAKSKYHKLGTYFKKYGVQANATLAITNEVMALIGPDLRSVLLALAEVHQAQGNWKEAAKVLKELYRRDENDVVVSLSLAELAVEEAGDKRSCQTAVRLGEGVENESELHAALLLYRARALRTLGLHIAARDTLTATLRKKKDRSDELLKALRYERMLVYEALGHDGRMNKELQRLYAEDVDYEDVAQRLELA